MTDLGLVSSLPHSQFYNLCEHDEEEETDDDNDPDVIENVPEIFKIDDDLFNFDSPLCIAFEEFNHLLKIDPDLFTTYDIQGFKTYNEYAQELNNKAQGNEEPWSENGVPYYLGDHICEPYRILMDSIMVGNYRECFKSEA
ncbi:hypothetical protein Tco_0114390 [Tanacetum coccineum]